MRLRRPSGSGWSAVALALVASLAGVPQALQSAREPEHRCQCPAGDHACSCPRCAAARAAARRAGHGPAASSSRTADASGARPPCHGGAPPGPRPEEETPPRSDAPCLSPACGGTVAVAAQPGGVDPFVLHEDRTRIPPGRPEGFAPVDRLTPVDPSAPEPPPPRA